MSKKTKKLLWITIAFLATSMLVFAYSVIVSLIGGYGFEFALALFRMADGWVFGALLLACLSLEERIKEGGITAKYIIGLVFAILAILSFFTAITAGTAKGVIIAFISFIVCSICSISIPAIISHIKGKTDGIASRNDFDENIEKEELENDWLKIKLKLSNAKAREDKENVLFKYMLFYPINNNILLPLDLNSPVLMKDNKIYSIKAAEKDSIFSATEIDSAKSKIKTMLSEYLGNQSEGK